ncbi:hypothetical protein [Shewanella sp. 10N.286.54.B9]|uniref:hypothetical protein n=1 Tax=Shewanella sp. 10N.286.54.B9 TaxID=3229719 RepID=UPI00354C5746
MFIISKNEFFSKSNSIFLALCLLFIIIDTGGWSNLRFVGLSGVLMFFIYSLKSQNLKNKKAHFVIAMLLFVSVLPGLIYPSSENQIFQLGVSQTLPVFLYPVLLMLININRDTYQYVVSTLTRIFALVILLFFFSRVFDIGPANSFAAVLDAKREAGFFDFKSNLLGQYLPVVYFKATLLLVPLGLYCYITKFKLSFYLALAALFVAPSRTGFLVLLLFYIFINFVEFKVFLKFILISISVYCIYLVSQFIALESFLMGFHVRLEHLLSLSNLSINYENLLLGQGAGTFFYSTGFKEMTDGVELSQLEYIRRYGLISFLVLCFAWAAAGYTNREWRLPIVAFWITALSNPVLAVFFSFTLLAIINSKSKSQVVINGLSKH